MKSFLLARICAALLIVALVAPPTFFIAPQPARAQFTLFGVPTGDFSNWIQNAASVIQETLSSINTATSAWAQTAQWIDANILQPLAFVLSGRLMQFMTSSVIAFVVGKSNGTGVPQFMVDVEKSFQTVSDSQALAYLNQLGRHSNSPFGSSIQSALYNNYASKTSLAGFWAANLNTLRRSSPNVPGFLSGRWQDGGLKAWFALTTQVQNNPYTDFERKRDKLATVIGAGPGGATGAHAKQADWGRGFLSWCGSPSSPTTTEGPSSETNFSTETSSASGGGTFDATAAQTAAQSAAQSAANTAATQINSISPYTATSAGVSPGAPCINPDGTSGTIKTPGSVIQETFQKVLGGEQDRIVRMGNVGPMINSILNSITTVMRTANFAVSLLGGASGGLFGVDGSSSVSSSPRLIQYQAAPPLGTSNTTAIQGSGTSSASISDMSSRIAQYEAAWNTIAGVANTASSSLSSLETGCASQVGAAQTARTNLVDPVLAQAAQAEAAIATARATVQQAQSEYASGSPSYATTLQTLQTMTPTSSDVSSAQQNALATNAATADPVGSLNVSGGTTVDRMTLLHQNAQALRASCPS